MYQHQGQVKSENILLAIGKNENQRLISELLGPDYNLELYDQIGEDDFEPDLLITDPISFSRLETEITRLKEEEKPTYLPVMILVSKNNQQMLNKSHSLLSEYIIDDLLKVPLPKIDFLSRIKNLLHIRELSLLAEKNYHTLAGESPVGVCILQNNEIIYSNKAFAEISNTSERLILNSNILDFIAEEDRILFNKFINNLRPKKSIETRLDKGNKWIETRCSRIIYKGMNSKLLIISDITNRKKTEEHIKYLSFHDKLTGLYNRAYFEEELERLNTERQLPLSIVLGDVNGLKLTNDAFGHQKGNELLIEISELITKEVRQEDIVARVGGDEFGILLPKTGEKEVAKIISRINDTCKDSCSKPIKLSIALGAATKERQEEDIDEIFNIAEDRMYRNKIAESKSTRNSIFSSLENTLYEKTYESKAHSSRMEKLAVEFHHYLDLPDYILDELKLLARLHDIGKVAINESILKKPEGLSEEEYESVKRHSEIGYQIVREMPSLAHVSDGILAHHERWDGNGYPQGLKGREIPTISRIINIIDSYDVMTNKRVYKSPMSREEALREIANCSGKQFDPNFAEEFIKMMKTQNIS